VKRNSTLLGTLIALAMLFFATANTAHAQARAETLGELNKDWTLRAGAFFASSNATRNAIGTVGFSGSAERKVYRTDNYDLYLGMGYNGMDRVYSVPIMFNIMYHRNALRLGGGFGYSFGKRLDGRGFAAPALSLNAGLRIRHGNMPLDVDVRYLIISGSNSELDGFAITLGLSF
jgi:hypothetical protein